VLTELLQKVLITLSVCLSTLRANRYKQDLLQKFAYLDLVYICS